MAGENMTSKKQRSGRARLHFVLVHGVCHGAWCWYKVATLLRTAGHAVTAVDLAASSARPERPEDLRSLADYSRPLMEVVAAVPAGEKVVLVGHSYGGVCISVAMLAYPEKTLAAVFATAVMPSPDCNLALITQEFMRVHTLEGYMDSKVEMDEDNLKFSVTFGKEYLSTKLYQLSPPEDLTLATSLLRPGTMFVDDISMAKEAYNAVRRVFIVCKEDKSICAELQRWMAKRSGAGTEVKEIEGADHMVMLSKPKDLCDVLVEIGQQHQSREKNGSCF